MADACDTGKGVDGATLSPTLQLLDQAAAARILGVQPSTLERWRFEGKALRWVKIGRLCRYRLSDIQAYLDGSTRTSTHAPTQNPATGT